MPRKIRTAEARRADNMWRKYRLRPADLLKLEAKANYACEICLTPFSESPYRVDHDWACCPGERSCGKCVRGLLCLRCNANLGWLEKNKQNANTYLGL